jgi:eukaryotic-like serine/threonine-protein kinase
MPDPRLLSERWVEADAVLSEALELPPSEREALVRLRVPVPGPFQELVLRLTRHLDADDSRVSLPSQEIVAGAFGESAGRDAPDLEPGTRVARYVLRGRLARGGMATVYAAERADGVYEQRVAVKVLRRGLDTEDLARRFRAERQILSTLTHPNIAQLLDGGELPDGRPYLVMEEVDGQRITEFADERRLDLRARLDLFLGVANAVHAAHRQLVVHRDIKPSNILVDRHGAVKLLDFGIAKLLDQEDASAEASAVLLTPRYASPEQLHGGAITTAADVFQLGLLLRELLVGVRPVADAEPVSDTGPSVSQMALAAVPHQPSPSVRAAARSTTPVRLSRALAGDLDFLIGKATRAEPEARYASALQLATDVQRYLRGLPLLAHPDNTGYRARKFLMRNPWGTAAAVIALALGIGYVVTVTTHSSRVALERDRAALEAQKAGEVTDFMVDLFQAASPEYSLGAEVTVREVLDEGANRLRDADLVDPAVRGAMLTAMGRSYSQLGFFPEAEELLRRSAEAHRADPTGDGRALASTLGFLAEVVGHRNRTENVALHEEAIEVAESSVGATDPLVATLLTSYGLALTWQRWDDPRIDSVHSRAVRILRAAPGDVRRDLARALTVHARGKPPDEAIPLMREALELRRAVYPERHPAVAESLNDLALALEPADPMAADTLMTQAVAILRSIHHRPVPTLLSVINNLAALRRDRGAFVQAEPLYREVLDLRRELYPDQRLSQAYTLYGLGIVLTETGRATEGEAQLRTALAILEEEMPDSALLARTRSAIGGARVYQGAFADAEQLLLPAWESLRAMPTNAQDLVPVLSRIVRLYDAWGRPEEAAGYARQLDSLRAVLGRQHS